MANEFSNEKLREMSKLADDLVSLVAMKDELDDAIENIKKEIKERIGDCEEKIYAGDHVISCKSNVTTSVDSKRLREEMPEIFEKYARSIVKRPLLVK